MAAAAAMLPSLDASLDALGVPLSDLNTDSRQVTRGTVFLAYPGSRLDGRDFIADAIAHGAGAVVWERQGFRWNPAWQVPNLGVDGLRERASEIAGRVYGDPSSKLWMAGVTGTNGKTSVSQWVAQAFDSLGRRAAVVGTLGNGLVGERIEGRNTTPGAVVLQRTLTDFLRRGASVAAVEVSSHGLDQLRTAAVKFDAAVFTNLTRDHLDYHGTMQAYAEAKFRLFSARGLRHAIVNTDDAIGAEYARRLAGSSLEVISYGLAGGRLQAGDVSESGDGLRFRVAGEWGQASLRVPVLGAFNVSNLLAVLATLLAGGVAFDAAVEAIGQLQPVPGRLERLGGGNQPLVVIDYAHTPDALEKALASLRPVVSPGGRLLCVFGCGGDRDAGKRALMGAAATRHADRVYVTSDNPRGEDPLAIIAQILEGAPGAEADADRQVAIYRAVQSARSGDVVLLAGKGHETWQEIAGVRHPFSDSEVALEALAEFGP
jgi:UDP-N-acetylmuramoyl-L-alanyl-D-glutamate--2,6-diaminopimelate ligase